MRGSSIPDPSFDYSALDSATRAFLQERAQKIHTLARMTAAGIVQIGQHLIEAKERVGHGKFLDWISKEFAWTDQTARNFMHVHQRFKSKNFLNLPIDVSALYLIAAPKTPEPVRVEVMRRAESGEPITHEAVVTLRKRYEETGALPDSTTALVAMVRDAKREEAEARRALPSPAVAREQAIRTGQRGCSNGIEEKNAKRNEMPRSASGAA